MDTSSSAKRGKSFKFWHKVKRFFKTLKKNEYTNDDNDNDDDDESVDEILSDDYYTNPELHTGLIRVYLKFTNLCKSTINRSWFNNTILGVIIVAGVNIGAQTYPAVNNSPVMTVIDQIILSAFSIEALAKIFSEGLAPYIYFIGPEWKWNNFDFIIVFMSLPFWGGLFGGGSLALLRLVRLMRLAKLIKKIPALQMIVKGLSGGMSSITYIMILLILIFYLFSVVGFYLFQSNDPFNFGTLPRSLLTMVRICTLDNWGDVMYINIYGCDKSSFYTQEEDQITGENRLLWCTRSKAQFPLSAIYFISLVVVSAFVMLSLFIGAVTLSMADSLAELKKMTIERKKKEKYEKTKAKMFLANGRLVMRKDGPGSTKSNGNVSNTNLASPGGVPHRPGSSSKSRPNSASKSPELDFEIYRKEQALLDSISKINVGEDDEDDDGNSKSSSGIGNALAKRIVPNRLTSYLVTANLEKANQEKFRMNMWLRIALGEDPPLPEDNPKTIYGFVSRIYHAKTVSHKYTIVSEHCKWFAENQRFISFVTCIIVLAGINVGAQTDPRITNVSAAVNVLNILDAIILATFTFECILKLVGEGIRPWAYFRDNWNKFDFVVVVGSFLPGVGSLLTILRLLRLLRVIKLVKSLPQLALIASALLMGMASIGYIGLILFLFFYVYAIVGILLFATNDPWHFKTLHIAMFTLFRVSTLDDWTDVMYINLYGCDKYGGNAYALYPELCDSARGSLLAVPFFVSFILIGAQVLLTLFIGVITTSMDQAKEIQNKELKLEKQLSTLCNSLSITDIQMGYFRLAYSAIDLDGSGTIDEEMVSLALSSITEILEGTDLQTEAKKADPEGRGVNLISFIVALNHLPKIKCKRIMRRTVRNWIENKRKKGLFFRKAEKVASNMARTIVSGEIPFATTIHAPMECNAILFQRDMIGLMTEKEQRSRSGSQESISSMTSIVPINMYKRASTWSTDDSIAIKIMSIAPPLPRDSIFEDEEGRPSVVPKRSSNILPQYNRAAIGKALKLSNLRGLGLDIVGSVSEKIVDGVDTITDSFVGFTSGMDDFGHKMSNIAKYPSKFGKDCMSPNTK